MRVKKQMVMFIIMVLLLTACVMWWPKAAIAEEFDKSLVTEVTLLSGNEYEALKDNIPLNPAGKWWVREPSSPSSNVAAVDAEGILKNYSVNSGSEFIRPALVCDLSSADFSIGDKVSLAGYEWTVISDSIILCDEFVGTTNFTPTIYADSSVKQWLDHWWSGEDVTISHDVWMSQVNAQSASSTLPLRLVQTFQRNTSYTSIDQLPEGAIRIDDKTIAFGYIYFWVDGETGYWWSNCDVIYLPSDASSLFYECRNITSLDLSGWDTSKVTTMTLMFYRCTGLSSLDVTGFDTSNVTDTNSMFADCRGLTSLDVRGFNTSNATNMGSMFSGCGSLTSLDVSGFNTSKVTNMGFMFSHCSSLTFLDVSGFDTSKVTNMSAMFQECNNLTSLDVSGFNTSKVTKLGSMFVRCVRLGVIDVSGWNTSSVTDMFGTFAYCHSITSLDVSGFDTSNVTNMQGTFEDCKNLTSLDLSNFDTNKATKISRMLNGCEKLSVIFLGEKYKTAVASRTILLPTPPSLLNGVAYSGKWVHEDGVYGPFTPSELKSNYDNETMFGKWVWEAIPTEYTLRFSSANYPDAAGEMAQVAVSTTVDYQLAANQYGLFGFVFDHWDDGNGHIYADKAIIPANTYNMGDIVTLNLVMTKRDTSVTMQDGGFEFSIRADETALFDPVPANTTYQVYEQTPKGWNLIYQDGNSGTIGSLITSEAIFLNQYDPSKVTIRLAGTKLLDEAPAEEGSFVFLLCEDEELIDIATVQDGGLIEFQPITYDRTGVHHYYISEAVGSDVGINYDTHVEAVTVTVTEDDDGGLDVDVDMDENEILFENVSKPGKIILRKLGANERDSSIDGTFYYELQFFTANGQPYELFGSTITYEERDDNGVNYPDLQPVEKQKYILTVKYIRENLDGTVQSEEVNTYEYYAGDIFTLDDLNDSTYRFRAAEGLGILQVGSAWNGVMPRSDSEVSLRYEPVKAATINKSKWETYVNRAGYGGSGPLRSATTFTRNESCASVEDLPAGARRIDGGQTACSIYFWKDGTDAYWWSDADKVYLPTAAGAMFYGCDKLTSLDVSEFDTSKVTTMDSMFYGCSALVSLDGLSLFDTSHVTNMYDVFSGCKNLTGADVADWNTSNVTNMEGMFASCNALTSLDVTGFDTSKVTNMRAMFASCNALTSLDVTGFDTSNVTSMRGMFSYCSGLTSLDVSGFDTSSVTTMQGMFRDCSGLTSLDVSGFDTSKVTNMRELFYRCSGLTSLDVSRWDTSKVTMMGSGGNDGMFRFCSSLTSLDVSQWDTGSVTHMGTLFAGCENLSSLDVSGFDTSNVTSMNGMFSGCRSLTSLDVSGFDTSKVTNLGDMFYGCTGLTSLEVSDWVTNRVTNMNWMFYGCTNLASLDVSGWTTNSVTSMRNMFSDCSSLTVLDVSGWDTSNVVSVAYPGDHKGLFSNCKQLTVLDLSGWHLSNVTDTSFMFDGCNGLTSLDLSGFVTNNVTNMDCMFRSCKLLNTIYVDMWDLSSVTSSDSMFGGCSNLVGENGTIYSNSHVNKTYARIDNPPDEPGYFTHKTN